MTYLTHAFVALNQTVHGLNGQECLVHAVFGPILPRFIFVWRVKNIRRNNCSQVVDIHLAAGLFIDVTERAHPVQKREQDFQSITMRFG